MTITLLVLSPEPVPAPANQPAGTKWVNYVSTFTDHIGLTDARIASMEMVDTDYFLWLDSDDPMPTMPSKYPSKALMYGTEHRQHRVFRSLGVHRPIPIEEMDHEVSIANLHKAIVRTDLARKAALLVPRGIPLVPEPFIFHWAGRTGGYEISDDMLYHWHPGKFHRVADAKQAIFNTKDLLNNLESML